MGAELSRVAQRLEESTAEAYEQEKRDVASLPPFPVIWTKFPRAVMFTNFYRYGNTNCLSEEFDFGTKESRHWSANGSMQVIRQKQRIRQAYHRLLDETEIALPLAIVHIIDTYMFDIDDFTISQYVGGN